MDNRPVGLFDSGLGGITAFAALRELMPEENIIYFGDTGRMPYGTRKAEQLRRMTLQDMERMKALGAKAIISACGTATSAAMDIIEDYPIPTVGVINATVRKAAASCGDSPIGLIATDATVRSGVFQREIKKLRPETEVLAVGCPDFVTLIESGHGSEDEDIKEAVARYLQPLKAAGVSTLILGCTHFGIISRAISRYLPGVELISASACAAEEMCRLLNERDMEGHGGEESFYTSGDTEQFGRIAALLLGREKLRVEFLPPQEV